MASACITQRLGYIRPLSASSVLPVSSLKTLPITTLFYYFALFSTIPHYLPIYAQTVLDSVYLKAA